MTKRRRNALTRMMICLLSAALMITAMPVAVSAYDLKSEPAYEGWDFAASAGLKNAKQQAVLEYIYADYLNGNERYKGSGQCYGYAEKIRKMFGTRYKQRKFGVKLTKANFYKKLRKAKPGTHVRLAAAKGGGGRAHSVVLIKLTKDTIWYTDGNVDYNNGIRYSEEPLEYFCSRHAGSGRRYLVWAREPKGGVPAVKKLSVKTNAYFDGPETHVAWRPVKKAKKYLVYRSTSKNSGYALVGQTKACRYIDISEGLYGDVYYKVVAVKAKNKKSSSKPVLARRRVKAPVAYLTINESQGSTQFDITWNPVKGAARYKIYKWNYSKDRAELLATVSGTSWSCPENGDAFYEFYISAEAARGTSESYPAILSW